MTRTLHALDVSSAGRGEVREDEAWQAARTPDGPGTMALRRRDGEVEAEAWGPGAAWLLDTLPYLLGLDDDPAGFDAGSGLVAELHRRSLGLHLGRTSRPFEAIVAAIVGQRVTSRQAKGAYRRLVAAFGEQAPGPRPLRLGPSADILASLAYEDYHRFGIERSRAVALIETARRARRLEEVVAMDREASWRRLLTIRGVGLWTAAAVMGIAWGDRDAVPVGDYHLPSTVSWALAGEPRGDDERMLELLAPYGGQRRRVVLLLKSARLQAPKYGPRSPIVSIEHL